MFAFKEFIVYARTNCGDNSLHFIHSYVFAGVPASMQKVMFKGKMRDDATLREHDVKKNAKIMLVGSTVTDVMSISAPDMKALKEEQKKDEASSKEPLSTQKV